MNCVKAALDISKKIIQLFLSSICLLSCLCWLKIVDSWGTSRNIDARSLKSCKQHLWTISEESIYLFFSLIHLVTCLLAYFFSKLKKTKIILVYFDARTLKYGMVFLWTVSGRSRLLLFVDLLTNFLSIRKLRWNMMH